MTYNTQDWPAGPPLSALVNRVHCMDALEMLALLPDASVDAIITDPPYYRVKAAAWDNQWPDPAAYLRWLGDHLSECKRVLKPNGSLYLFASPQMAARVEVLTGEYFNVLNNIRWIKEAGWHNKTRKEDIRSYLSAWESVILAEQYCSDVRFSDADYALWGKVIDKLRYRLRTLTLPHKEALIKVFAQDGRYNGENSIRVNAGRQLGWLPTEFELMAHQIYVEVIKHVDLGMSYEDLRREYEDLRREYDYLRREYDYLRRPFNARPDAPYTDVWDFETVGAYPGKHECEKPMALGRHIVQMSTRPDALVLDLFAGSGALLDAARHEGRQFIGAERDSYWCRRANARLELPVQQHFFELLAAVSS